MFIVYTWIYIYPIEAIVKPQEADNYFQVNGQSRCFAGKRER